MNKTLRILHLEDDPLDAALVESNLTAANIDCTIHRVQTREDFVAALQHGGVDLILSDFTLPAFDGFAAIEIVNTEWPDVPLILVSGTLGEDRAVDSLQRGATDYVLKDHLARLAPAVRRAMQTVQDRAERRRLEMQCIEAQKMEVIGQLAGGVAHDFNNILAVILGYSDMLMSGLDSDNPLQKAAEEIRHAADRAAGLTRQLLVLSRKETAQPVVLDLDEVVKGLDKMLRRLIDENITMTIVLETLCEQGADIGWSIERPVALTRGQNGRPETSPDLPADASSDKGDRLAGEFNRRTPYLLAETMGKWNGAKADRWIQTLRPRMAWNETSLQVGCQGAIPGKGARLRFLVGSSIASNQCILF